MIQGGLQADWEEDARYVHAAILACSQVLSVHVSQNLCIAEIGSLGCKRCLGAKRHDTHDCLHLLFSVHSM